MGFLQIALSEAGSENTFRIALFEAPGKTIPQAGRRRLADSPRESSLRRIQPRLAGVTVPVISSALGVSNACKKWPGMSRRRVEDPSLIDWT